MAVTVNEISNWLNDKGLSHQVIKENNKILFGFKTKDDLACSIKIKVKEDGELLQIYSNLLINEDQDILKVKDHKYSALVLQHMLKINYNEKFGTWEFDPKDGEIRFAVEIPLEDAIMTEKQFDRIISHVLNSDSGFLEISKIMETGECPEDSVEQLFMDLDNFFNDDEELTELLDNHNAERFSTKKKDDVEDGI
ncbi:MAG: hypothetical protein U9N59_16840 [Campylobacterota bacterium]|nr:hypothetical protein [Campylobacterota bacterium]